MRQFSLSVASDGNADNKKMNIAAMDNKVTICLFTSFNTLLTSQLSAFVHAAVYCKTVKANG